jgi:hypothetical protein
MKRTARRQMGAGTIACLAAAALAAALPSQEPPAVAERPDEREWLHALGDQTWDFRHLAAAYKPLKGELNPQTGEAVWTLELTKDLTPGEVAVHQSAQGSPFKPVFLDEERVPVKGAARIKLSEISGRMGDAVRVTVQLPGSETLARIKTIRIERRTQVGF